MILACSGFQNFSFWERNEGTFLGAISAGLVAVITVYLSTYLNNKKEVEKNLREETNKYSGLLSLIHTELNAHKLHLQLLKNSLNTIKELSIERRFFIVADLPMRFDLSFVNDGLRELCKFQNFDHQIMILLITYKNLVNSINLSLEFERANKLLFDNKDGNNIEESIESYFNVLEKDYLNKIDLLITDIRMLIERNVTKSDMLIFREIIDK